MVPRRSDETSIAGLVIRDQRLGGSNGRVAQYPNLAVMRPFSKAYGLAGLRVGLAVC